MTDVRVVQTDSDTSLSHILEQTPVSPSTVLQVQEGSDTVTIPASFARAASPPPSTRRRMQRDDSTTRTTPTAPTEIRSPPMSTNGSRRSSVRRSSSPGTTRARSNSFTSVSTTTPVPRSSWTNGASPDNPPAPEHRRRGTSASRTTAPGRRSATDDDDDVGGGDEEDGDTHHHHDADDDEYSSSSDRTQGWHGGRRCRRRRKQRVDATTTAADADADDDGEELGKGSRDNGLPHVPKNEVSIVVGGRRFVIDPDTFHRYPDTMLSRMFSTSLEHSRTNEHGDHVIDYPVSADVFAAIMKFYRTGTVECPPTTPISELHEACKFFLIPFDHKSIDCNDVGKLLHELSNKGAIRQFEAFLKHSLLPAMAKCAEIGDRKCHVVVLRSEQTVEWDDDFPPSLGEQFAKVVYDTALNRFLFSYENRNIARQLLKEKGLKKIKLGIEGFPTFVERTRIGPNHEKLEVEYFYDQSPFIKASWEKEEHKSRHVDFQYVRTNTSANVLSTIMTS